MIFQLYLCLIRYLYIMRFIVFFCGILLMFGCKKQKLDASEQNCIGDFEWVYSTNETLNVISQDNYADNYGIRIKKNSKAFVFKNEEIIYKGVITNIGNKYSESYIIYTESSNEFIEFKYINEVLISKDWPSEGHDNYYLKK